MLSFVVPAHNEAALIARTLAAIHTAAVAAGEPFEVIVVDDASTDGTADIAAASGASVVKVELRQIAAVRNAGADAAAGEMLIFVDADTIVDAAVISAVIEAMRSGAVGGGAEVRFDEPLPRWLKRTLPMWTAMYRALGYAAGCFVFSTRAAFEAVGGFDTRVYAGEEIYLSRALKRHGRFVILRTPVISSARKARTHSGREIAGTFLRIALSGSRALRDRRRLDLWYGARRTDVPRR